MNSKITDLRPVPRNQVISFDEMLAAYWDCIKMKRSTLNAFNFETNFEDNLHHLWLDILYDTYKIGTSIAFVVTRPKLREVFAADFRDRIVHHLVINKLIPLFENKFITDSYSCRKGKGVLYGVQRLSDKIRDISEGYKKDCYIGKFDLKGFFMSINKKLLLNKLLDFIRANYFEPDKKIILRLVEQIVIHEPQNDCVKKSPSYLWKQLDPSKSLFTCPEGHGLAIGNLSSQWFANFMLNDFDHYMENLFSGYYGRYVDDFYILAPTAKDITSQIVNIENHLNSLELKLSPTKKYIQPYWHGVNFIGYTVKKSRIYIGNHTVSNILETINRVNNMPVNEENALSLHQSMNSYFGFLRHSRSYNIRAELWELIDDKWKNILGPGDKELCKLIKAKNINWEDQELIWQTLIYIPLS